MKKRGFLAFLLIFTLILAYDSFAENGTLPPPVQCITFDHLDCYNDDLWWFDSCGNPDRIQRYCTSYEECVDRSCRPKCGNGRCDSDEDCSRCQQDCGCSSYEKCTFGHCETYCGNGRCDSNENCASCYDCQCSGSQECSPGNAKADDSGCVDKCGNGIRDGGEDCSSCPADAGCSTSTYCYNGQCVDCIKDEHCTTRDTPTGEFSCASDFKSTIEKVIRKAGVCRDHRCTGEEEITTRPGKLCGDKLCQNNHCGCEERYRACLKTGKCEKVESENDGSNCGCYFQCKSNYCNKEGKCIQALNVPISSASSLISVGESTKVTISADNALDVTIPTKLTLNIDSGAIMSGVIGGSDCSGNQCTSGSISIMPKSREAITVDVSGQSAGKIKFVAVVTATIDGEDYPITKDVYITIINPKDGQCTEGETSQNSCKDCGCPTDTTIYKYDCSEKDYSCHKSTGWWIFVGILGFIFVAILIYLGATKGRVAYAKVAKELVIRKELKEKAETEKQEKKEAERKRVAKALYALAKKIDFENPPPISEVLKKIKIDADEELIHEEYLELLERLSKSKSMGKTSSLKQQSFCTKCGERLKVKSKFCTKCGTPTKS